MVSNDHTSPWWVNLLTSAGRPAVAVIVMTMCAPGEHHLATLAGWTSNLAWGMAAVMAAYAGIAAVVASKRPKHAPGKRSAVCGAWLSITAAMAAQPVSHLFVTGWLSATPRAPWVLVVAVSCVPPLTFGHLLHLAATPMRHSETPDDAPLTSSNTDGEQPAETPDTPAEQPAPADETTPDTLITTREALLMLGISRATFSRYTARGLITPHTVDPRRGNLYNPNDIITLRSDKTA